MEISEEVIKRLQRELWVTRTLVLFSTLLMIVILAAGYYLYRVVQVYIKQAEGYVTEIVTYTEDMKPAMNRLKEVDADALCNALEEMSVAFGEVDFEQLVGQLEALDMVAINQKLDSLDVDAINAKLDSLDVDAINAKLDSLDVDAINEKLDALDVQAINAKLGALDVDALNAKIYALDVEGINATIQGIDAALLRETLENLNEAVETVKDISAKLQQIATIFS